MGPIFYPVNGSRDNCVIGVSQLCLINWLEKFNIIIIHLVDVPLQKY